MFFTARVRIVEDKGVHARERTDGQQLCRVFVFLRFLVSPSFRQDTHHTDRLLCRWRVKVSPTFRLNTHHAARLPWLSAGQDLAARLEGRGAVEQLREAHGHRPQLLEPLHDARRKRAAAFGQRINLQTQAKHPHRKTGRLRIEQRGNMNSVDTMKGLSLPAWPFAPEHTFLSPSSALWVKNKRIATPSTMRL